MELGNFNGQTLSGWSASTIIFVTPRNWNNNFLYYLLVIGIITLILMIVLAIIFCFWYKRNSGQKQNTKIESNDGNAISNIELLLKLKSSIENARIIAASAKRDLQ